jgi:thiamine pyrophosphokinase
LFSGDDVRALLFANGYPVSREFVARWMQPGAIVIAADGGAQNALDASVTPDTVIGDLDSLPDSVHADLKRMGVRFLTTSARKDETDLELAIGHALERGATEIVILSGLGDRWDQSLANMLLLTLPALRNAPARIEDERHSIRVISSGMQARVEGAIGDTLSLIALGGDARGVTVEGCEYPLRDAVLPFGKTLGISNVLSEPVARISVQEGIVLAIHIRET